MTHPARAVLAAAWDGAGSGGGRLMVVGSSEMWADAWMEQRAGAEGNARWAEAAVAVRVCVCVFVMDSHGQACAARGGA